MAQIIIEGIRLYAYHGCLEEEAKIGANYIVDVTLEADLTGASKFDDLEKTIDYVEVYNIVKEEMAIRSKLIEHVAARIIQRLQHEFKMLQQANVKVTKLNPPMNGEVDRVSVLLG